MAPKCKNEKCLMKCLSENLVLTNCFMKFLNEINYYLCNGKNLDKFTYVKISKMNG